MMLAAVRQDVELVRLMAGKGADLNVRDRSGSTALMWGAFNDTGDAAMVEALMGLGADPLASNKAGETALDWALRRGETPAVAALRKAGASNSGRMHSAAQKSLALCSKADRNSPACRSAARATTNRYRRWRSASLEGVVSKWTKRLRRAKSTTRSSQLKSVAAEALRNRDRIPDPPIALSYALLEWPPAGIRQTR